MNNYIDPSWNFFALSNDSYLTKKNLLEIQLINIKISNTTDIINELGTNALRLRIKITVNNLFWTTTSYMTPILKDNYLSCEFKLVTSVRIPNIGEDYDENLDNVKISLHAIASEEVRIPDALRTLKNELEIGFTIVRLNEINGWKKPRYIPLNGGVTGESPFIKDNEAHLLMKLNVINDVIMGIIIRFQEITRNQF